MLHTFSFKTKWPFNSAPFFYLQKRTSTECVLGVAGFTEMLGLVGRAPTEALLPHAVLPAEAPLPVQRNTAAN